MTHCKQVLSYAVSDFFNYKRAQFIVLKAIMLPLAVCVILSHHSGGARRRPEEDEVGYELWKSLYMQCGRLLLGRIGL